MLSKDFLFNDEKIYQIVTISNILFKLNYHNNIFDNIYFPYRFTKKEQEFINNHILKCITTINWPPFNTLQNGKIVGIAIDYWKYIKDKLHLKSKCISEKEWLKVLESIKTKKADLTLSTTNTPDREKYAVFTKAYASFPIAIATRNNVGYISNIKDLYNKKIAVGKNFTAEKVLKHHYPKLKFIETRNTQEALKLVSENRAYAAVDILPVLIYKISKYNFANLKISGMTKFTVGIKIMIIKDYKILVPMINRVIDNMPESKKEEIYHKWIKVKMQNGYSKENINKFILTGGLFLFLIGGWGIYAYFNIQNQKKLEEQLLELSEKDGLTKIYNRRKIDEILDKEIKIAKRYNESLSLIFFDVDHFKQINDTFGHKAGDKVLIELTKLVKNNIRESDYFGRWGGEEFIIVCPHTDLESAKKLAEKLRKVIEEAEIDGIKLTCSFGVTQIIENDTLESSTSRVDKLLYISKETGRNKITFD
jgi:polar amino acid transport system substrate-binding protein